MPNATTINQSFNDYVNQLFAPEDNTLKDIKTEMAQENIRAINVSAIGGKTLQLLVQMIGAKRILEIGTLGGYSATWMARALPDDGQLISLELEEHHAEVARRNLTKAGVGDKVEVRVGPAAKTLQTMQTANEEQFDLVFIDADKDGYPQYLALTMPLLRDGGLLLADNTFRDDVLNPNADTGIARYNAAVAAHPQLTSMLLPMLRTHGLDGLLVSLKQAAA